jgi:hypothetical protein
MHDSALRAASVASQVAGGCRQLSQLAQPTGARAAGRRVLAEVAQQPHAAAVVRLGQRQQRLELACAAAA